jgi:hypothetical protein
MMAGMRTALAALATAIVAAAAAAGQGRLDTWRRDARGTVTGAPDAGRAVPVGSLQKPFVAEAWAAAHPGTPAPRFRCDGRSCWRPSGHGALGLARATSVSCNAAFLALAADTPPAILRSTLEAEGFVIDGEMTPEAAIGMGDAVVIPPGRLLESYVRLTRTPWVAGDALRREVLAGLRQAAHDGTARGLARRGVWAKTGTVEDPDRRGLATIGWTLAVDDSGAAVLARLQPGTGRQAAEALGRKVDDRTMPAPHSGPARRIRVLLFEAIRPRSVRAENRSPMPAARARGPVRPGDAVWLSAGDRLGESLWRLALPDRPFDRTVKAALFAEAGRDGRLQVVAEMDAREYVSGMIAAEMPDGSRARRVELGAAALRFSAAGPRHPRADLCDTTHCAWFIGRGPRVRWPSPRRPVAESEPVRALGDEEWTAILAAARQPGLAHWTAHCGGQPLSEHAVWGRGDRHAPACPLHAGAPPPSWTRFWSDDALRQAFGARVTRVRATVEDGVRRLLVESGGTTRRLLYDDAHRALAAVLGWDALPSPPESVTRVAAGFRADGVGAGHRVGLCLGGGGARSAAARGVGRDGEYQALDLGHGRPRGLRGAE